MDPVTTERLWLRDDRGPFRVESVLLVQHDGTSRDRRAAIARAVHKAMAVQVQPVRGTDGQVHQQVTRPNTVPMELRWTTTGAAAIYVGAEHPRLAGAVMMRRSGK